MAPLWETIMELPDPEGQPPAHDTTRDPLGHGAGDRPEPRPVLLGRVTATAEALGYRMLRVGDPTQVRDAVRQWRPRVVVLDLTAGELVAPAAVAGYRQMTGPATWYVAVGPHVQADLLDAAREAGCQVVLPRSKFSAELPALMRRYFSRPADQPEPPA